MLHMVNIFQIILSLLLNAKNKIVSTNVIKSSCSGNKFKIANQKSFMHTDYLKISFYTNILLYLLFLSVKYMHPIAVSDVHFL